MQEMCHSLADSLMGYHMVRTLIRLSPHEGPPGADSVSGEEQLPSALPACYAVGCHSLLIPVAVRQRVEALEAKEVY